jgi:hypothetical protein
MINSSNPGLLGLQGLVGGPQHPGRQAMGRGLWGGLGLRGGG